MGDAFEVTVSAGSLRPAGSGVRFTHRWTDTGVTVEADFTGAHLLHVAAAGCVLNDLYREAGPLGVELRGVKVVARGGFDTSSWASTGITYQVSIDSPAPADRIAELLAVVDDVAEIPKALRSGLTVHRTPAP